MPSTTTSCPGCGAALNADYTPGQITYVSCPYCNNRVAVTAPGIHDAGQAAPAPAAVDPARIRRMALILAVAGAFVVIATAGSVIVTRMSAPEEKTVMSESLVPETADRSSTIVCYGDRRMVLENETITKDKTAVVTSGRCRLTIKNASLGSPSTTLVASGDSVVTIDNSTVSGESTAIIASGRARVRIVTSSVKSAHTGLISSGSAVVDLDGSLLQGGESAYIQNGEGRIILKDTQVQGRGTGKVETR
jgi:hypothetical protein